MNEAAADVWYFTREGERLGPVTFAELRGKVSEGGLNPRLDMVWKSGMEAWKPSGEIDGLFERAAMPATEDAAPAGSPPSAAQAGTPAARKDEDPYAPPGDDVMEQLRQAKWPGARRRMYLFLVILFPLLWNTGVAFGAPMLTETVGTDAVGFVMAGAVLVPLVLSIIVSLERFANLGMSRWWIFGQLVPFLNLWVGYRLFACPAGYRYHKKMDGPGIALAIVYWLSILAVVAVLVAMVVMVASMAGDPEFQNKLQELMRKLQVQTVAPPEGPAPLPEP